MAYRVSGSDEKMKVAVVFCLCFWLVGTRALRKGESVTHETRVYLTYISVTYILCGNLSISSSPPTERSPGDVR